MNTKVTEFKREVAIGMYMSYLDNDLPLAKVFRYLETLEVLDNMWEITLLEREFDKYAEMRFENAYLSAKDGDEDADLWIRNDENEAARIYNEDDFYHTHLLSVPERGILCLANREIHTNNPGSLLSKYTFDKNRELLEMAGYVNFLMEYSWKMEEESNKRFERRRLRTGEEIILDPYIHPYISGLEEDPIIIDNEDGVYDEDELNDDEVNDE